MIGDKDPEILEQLFSQSGRTAIVTGASRGIGWALASGLASAGATVVALARSESPDKALPGGIEYHRCDVLDTVAFERCMNSLIDRYSRLDVLINCAGVTVPGADMEGFDTTIATNLRAPFQCAQIAATPMKLARRGSIINVTSLGAHRGFPDKPAYAAAKGGLSQLTRSLAFDLGPTGIRVNNLVPGYIATDMTAASNSDPEAHAHRRRHTMLERWGEPADLIGAAIFLASDASAYITGQDIVVDGGWLAKGLV